MRKDFILNALISVLYLAACFIFIATYATLDTSKLGAVPQVIIDITEFEIIVGLFSFGLASGVVGIFGIFAYLKKNPIINLSLLSLIALIPPIAYIIIFLYSASSLINEGLEVTGLLYVELSLLIVAFILYLLALIITISKGVTNISKTMYLFGNILSAIVYIIMCTPFGISKGIVAALAILITATLVASAVVLLSYKSPYLRKNIYSIDEGYNQDDEFGAGIKLNKDIQEQINDQPLSFETSKDAINALHDLKNLKDAGIITEEEFNNKKQKYINKL